MPILSFIFLSGSKHIWTRVSICEALLIIFGWSSSGRLGSHSVKRILVIWFRNYWKLMLHIFLGWIHVGMLCSLREELIKICWAIIVIDALIGGNKFGETIRNWWIIPWKHWIRLWDISLHGVKYTSSKWFEELSIYWLLLKVKRIIDLQEVFIL
jgi:hypothetical protein